MAIVIAMATATFGQAKAKLPKGVTLVDDAKQQELLQQIEQFKQSNPTAQVSSANMTATQAVTDSITTPMIGGPVSNIGLGNVEVVTLPGGEVVARVNLAGLPPYTYMVTSREYQGKEEFMQGVSVFGGCNGCSFDIEAGRKITWMDRPGFANYRAYFFSDGNAVTLLAQKGINGLTAYRFIKGNPREKGRKVEIDGNFSSSIVVSFRSISGAVYVVTEPDVRVSRSHDLLSVNLNSEGLQYLSPGEYDVTVSSGGYSNTTHMYLSLDGTNSVSADPQSGPAQPAANNPAAPAAASNPVQPVYYVVVPRIVGGLEVTDGRKDDSDTTSTKTKDKKEAAKLTSTNTPTDQ